MREGPAAVGQEDRLGRTSLAAQGVILGASSHTWFASEHVSESPFGKTGFCSLMENRLCAKHGNPMSQV